MLVYAILLPIFFSSKAKVPKASYDAKDHKNRSQLVPDPENQAGAILENL